MIKDLKCIKKDTLLEGISDIQSACSNYEFISLIYSPWHLDNLNIFLKEYKLTHGIIFVMPQQNINDETRFRIKESNFTNYDYSNCKIYFINSSLLNYSIKNLFARLFFYKRSTNTLFIINAGINLKFLSLIPLRYQKITEVIIDEGTGSYVPTIDNKYIEKLTYSKSKNKKFLLFDLKIFVNGIFVKIILFLLPLRIINYFMFFNKKEKLLPRPTICTNLCEYYTLNSDNTPRVENLIFFKDYDVIDDSALSEFYHVLFNHLLKFGKKIYIKKHPNDKGELFNRIIKTFKSIEVLNYDKSGEQLIADYKPKLIVGGYSTIVFTSPFIYNIKTFSYMLVYKNYNDLSLRSSKIIDNFYERFYDTNENLIFINDIKEIE